MAWRAVPEANSKAENLVDHNLNTAWLMVPPHSAFSYLERRDEGFGTTQHLAVLEDFRPLDSLNCCKFQKLLTKSRK